MRYEPYKDVEGCYDVSLRHLLHAYNQVINPDAVLLQQAIEKLQYIKDHPGKEVNMDWSDEHNIRHGFYASMTGLVSEYKVIFNLMNICSSIDIVTDRITQSWLGIDLETDIGSIQCKAVQFEGVTLPIYRYLFEHSALFTSLTDIDDNETYIIHTSILREWVEHRPVKRIDKNLFEHYCTYFFKNNRRIK